ncbi:MAG TPA: CARDB domain-containing protein [Thermoanaerobaculia bacterium]|nr:CARDB domain-containing protein [Thermoanaerobaculia bacterium]
MTSQASSSNLASKPLPTVRPVQSASGKRLAATLALLMVASFAAALPNLTPYQPLGWTAKIVVSNETGTTYDRAVDVNPLTTTDSLYVNFAVIDQGTTGTATSFQNSLFVDGVLNSTWDDPSLEAYPATPYWSHGLDWPIGSLSAGTHTITLVVDSTNAVVESDESDNTYTKTFTVTEETRSGEKIVPLSPGAVTIVDRGEGGPSSLLTGAKIFNGVFPSPTTVAYPTKDGAVFSSPSAYPGFVVVLVSDSVPSDAVAPAFLDLGGTIVGMIPLAGSYLVTVRPGSEASFISRVYGKPWVVQATPAGPALRGGVALDWNDPTDLTDVCGRLHASFVVDIMNRRRASSSLVDVSAESSDVIPLMAALVRQIEAPRPAGDVLVINLSLESPANNFPHLSSDEIADQEGAFLRLFLDVMEAVFRVDPDLADSTLITLIAGNGGVALDKPFQDLKMRYPNALARVAIVGGVDAAGNIDQRSNYLEGPSAPQDMIYARSKGVLVQPNVQCSGTSFAGPEIASVLDYLWSQHPEKTSAEILGAFRKALNGGAVVPQDGSGITTEAFVCMVLGALDGGKPTVTSFKASPATIDVGEHSTLSWATANTTSVSITSVGSVQPVCKGSVEVSPTTTTTYTLTGTGPGPNVTSTAKVTVNAVSPTCTYSYSAWSSCQSDGVQTRTVIASSPAGCTGTPVLTQSCTPPPPQTYYCINEWKWIHPGDYWDTSTWYGSTSPGQYPNGNAACNVYPYVGCVTTYTYQCGTGIGLPNACGPICPR